MKLQVTNHGVDDQKITIIPPWPIQKPQYSTIKRSENRFAKEHGLENKFVILYSGNHSIVHPLDTLLGTALALKDDDSVRFLFIGSGLRVKDVTQFRARHSLENIVQLPIQPRESLGESLSSANLHVVIMGESVSGLVHPSKIYGILASGRPYVYIGPKHSYVGDILSKCPFGEQVEHGDIECLNRVISKVRSLSQDSLEEIQKNNVEYVVEHFSRERSLDLFTRELVQGELKPPIGSELSVDKLLPRL